MDFPKLEELNSSNCTERSIELHYHEFWEYITKNYTHSTVWTERLYWFYHNITEFPKCPICGKPTKFINLKTGYREFCSRECMNSSNIIKQRKKETSMKNWGTNNPMQSEKIHQKIKQTNLERYGVENPFSSELVKEKIKQTNLERYGETHYMKTKEGQLKFKNTMLSKYGVEYNSQLESNKIKVKQTNIKRYGGTGYESIYINDKIKETNIKRYGTENISKSEYNRLKIKNMLRSRSIKAHKRLIGYTDDGKWIMKCPHNSCNKCQEKLYITHAGREYDRNKANLEPCTILNPINSNMSSLEEFVKNILNNNHIEYCHNVVGLIDGRKELDIYIPSKNIAIECNGIYWHSTFEKTKQYHQNKTSECLKHNIKLLHIWEDWIKNKPEIVESILLNKLGLINNSIYARKCIIKEIDSKTCNEFLDKNHIQGRSVASIRLGLYYNNELVSLMTFSQPRINMGGKNHKQQWELVRFCNKLNTRVVGGASKLLKYFIKIYHPTSIVSFSMNDISDGNLYKQLGFKTDGIITHSYWYIEPGTLKRYHRSSFTKQQIVKRGWKDKVDNTWTEVGAMEEQGYFKIYDSGQMKYVLELECE